MDNKTIGTISFDWPHSKRHGVKYCDGELEVNLKYAMICLPFCYRLKHGFLSLAVFDQ